MLKGIRFEIPEGERLVRNDVVGEFDDLDIKPAFGGHFAYNIRDRDRKSTRLQSARTDPDMSNRQRVRYFPAPATQSAG